MVTCIGKQFRFCLNLYAVEKTLKFHQNVGIQYEEGYTGKTKCEIYMLLEGLVCEIADSYIYIPAES